MSKFILKKKFLSSKMYLEKKEEYEKEHFKIGGAYAWYDGDKITNRSIAGTKEWFKNKTVIVNVGDDEGEMRKIEKSFYDIWSEDPNMREYDEVVFDCDVKNVKKNQFNLFGGFAVEKLKYSDNVNKKELELKLAIINEHIASLCNYNEEHIKLVKWYIAQMIKNPAEPPPICLIFISSEGVGKDLIFEFIDFLLGDKYTFNVDKIDSIAGRFNSMLGGKIFGVVNESNPVENKTREDNIKYLVTTKNFMLEGKYKDAVKTKNYTRFMFFTNRLNGFPLDEGARRPKIMNCSDKYTEKKIGPEANKKHFDELRIVMKEKDVQKRFYEELMEIDIENFNFKQTEKSELQQILEVSSRPPIVEFMAETIYGYKKLKYTIKKTTLLEKYTSFLLKRNMKYECNMKTFTVELQHKFKAEEFESGGYWKYRLFTDQVKDILLKEYKIDLAKKQTDKDDNDEDDDDDDDDEKEFKPNYFIKENDKAEYIRVEEHKKMLDNVKKELEKSNIFIEQLKEQIEEQKKKENVSIDEQLEHYKKIVRDLEKKRIFELNQISNKNQQKEWDQEDLKKTGKNIYIDKTTKKIYKVYKDHEDIEFDGNLFK